MIDTHTHYDDKRYDLDREQILKQLQEENISPIVNIGASLKSCKTTLKLTQEYDFIYGTIGVHPHDVEKLNLSDIDYLEEMASNNKIVAIGEIGLDYYYNNSPRDVQKQWFIKQIDLAKKLNLPVVIHSRDAAADCMQIVEQTSCNNGVVHCFSDSVEVAKFYVSRGFYLGIGGVITFKNAKTLVEVVQNIDIEHLLLETDCPYLSPEPHRGERNSSLLLKYVVSKIAEIKNITIDEVIEKCDNNAKKLFNI